MMQKIRKRHRRDEKGIIKMHTERIKASKKSQKEAQIQPFQGLRSKGPKMGRK